MAVDWKCPKCGQTQEIIISITCKATLEQGGFASFDDIEYDSSSPTACAAKDCDFSGTYADFEVKA